RAASARGSPTTPPTSCSSGAAPPARKTSGPVPASGRRKPRAFRQRHSAFCYIPALVVPLLKDPMKPFVRALALFAFLVVPFAVSAQKFEPQVGQAGKDVIWVPTPEEVVERMLTMAQVGPKIGRAHV